MLRNASHLVGNQPDGEILYDTLFGYMFEYLCGCPHYLLPVGPPTVHYLKKLGEVMADLGKPGDPLPDQDSNIPSVYTYLGQFIDHDITARTDRDTAVSTLPDDGQVIPVPPEEVEAHLRNGRRPQLDLDSVFGEGPSFNSKYTADADHLFNNTSLNLFLQDDVDLFDLRRDSNDNAVIADGRNDENLMISQLHAAFIKAFNRINTELEPTHSNVGAYVRARQLLCWTYQYIVINDYLNQVCDSDVVLDVLSKGPAFYQGAIPFMPLEFSVAAFRFGHSMIRPFYRINGTHTQREIMKLLSPKGNGMIENGKIKSEFIVEWENFTDLNGAPSNLARRIDPFIAKGLFDLSVLNEEMKEHPAYQHVPKESVLAVLTQRNLLRGYHLSIPTGQAIAKAMRVTPMKHAELVDGLNDEQKCIMYDSGFVARTPLWYYVLQEAKVQHDGQSLGVVGSRLVAETMIGMVKYDPNSYLQLMHDDAVEADGILLPGQASKIATISDLLSYAGVKIS